MVSRSPTCPGRGQVPEPGDIGMTIRFPSSMKKVATGDDFLSPLFGGRAAGAHRSEDPDKYQKFGRIQAIRTTKVPAAQQ